jgi:hypothetical protein
MPGLFNDVLCECSPREFDLLIRHNVGATSLDGLPSAIECGNQDVNGVRIKYAGLYVIAQEVAHFAPFSGVGEGDTALSLGVSH